jgi:RNA polymerase sigma factor (sigma-70 family)
VTGPMPEGKAAGRERFRALCQQVRPVAYRIAMARLRNAADADDVTQQVLLAFHTHFEELSRRDEVISWVIRVAKQDAIDLLRRRGRELLTPDIGDREAAPALAPDDDAAWAAAVIIMVRLYLLVLRKRGDLKDKHVRAWFQLTGGANQEQLAAEFGVTQPAISQWKGRVDTTVRAAIYVCELLGTVRPPQEARAVGSHLALLDRSVKLTKTERSLLRAVGGNALRLRKDVTPYLNPDRADAVLTSFPATRGDLHEAESKYAEAIPNRHPTCILAPCPLHRSPSRGRDLRVTMP